MLSSRRRNEVRTRSRVRTSTQCPLYLEMQYMTYSPDNTFASKRTTTESSLCETNSLQGRLGSQIQVGGYAQSHDDLVEVMAGLRDADGPAGAVKRGDHRPGPVHRRTGGRDGERSQPQCGCTAVGDQHSWLRSERAGFSPDEGRLARLVELQRVCDEVLQQLSHL